MTLYTTIDTDIIFIKIHKEADNTKILFPNRQHCQSIDYYQNTDNNNCTD